MLTKLKGENDSMKIILVDDEPLICQYIQECIRQCGNDHQVTACFYRASDALEYLKTHTVHLVITDITMPEMDGLSMSAAIQNQFGGNIDVVVLTCHRNFDFARKAMEYSVKDYIIKSEISPAKMRQLLDSIDSSRMALPTLKKLSVHYTQAQFLRSYFSSPDTTALTQGDRQTYGILLSDGPYISVVFPRFGNVLEKLSDYEDTRLTNHLLFLNEASTKYIFSANLNIPAENHEALQSCVRSLKNYLIQFCEGYIGISRIYNDITKLKDSFLEAEKAANLAFYGFSHKCPPREHKSLSYIQQEMFSLVNSAVSSMMNHISSDYYEYIEKLFDCAQKNAAVDPDYLYSLLNYAIMSTFIPEAPDYRPIYSEKLRTSSSFAKLKEHFYDFSRRTCQAQKAYSKPIEQAIKYINENYAENFTLTDLSQHVFLNKEYFCRKFKQEVGSNFAEYRLYVQLREAYREILGSTQHINIIAENVGINNFSYFSSAFKKQFGLTPSSVRKLNKHNQRKN